MLYMSMHIYVFHNDVLKIRNIFKSIGCEAKHFV